MGFRYRNFTLSATGSFIVGNTIYNEARENMDSDGGYTNLNQMSLNNGLGWIRALDVASYDNEEDRQTAIEYNKSATHPYAIGGRTDSTNKLSSRFLENGSFFRLRNVTFSYDLPATFLRKMKMGGGRIYVSGDNLLTISRFSGMDPEVSLSDVGSAGVCGKNYPVPLSVVLGIDLKF